MSPIVRLGVPRAVDVLKKGLIAHHVLAVAMACVGMLPVTAGVAVVLCAPLARAIVAFAEATAQGVAATRLTNLVVTLDKIKYVMRQPGQCRAPFLRPLRDDEVVEHAVSVAGIGPVDRLGHVPPGVTRHRRRECPRRRRCRCCAHRSGRHRRSCRLTV